MPAGWYVLITWVTVSPKHMGDTFGDGLENKHPRHSWGRIHGVASPFSTFGIHCLWRVVTMGIPNSQSGKFLRSPPQPDCHLAVRLQPAFARLAASINLSVAGERNFLQYAMPTPSGGGAGRNGRTFNRELARPLGNCAITATPLPDSTAAMRLVMLSCSSTICGEVFSGANKSAIHA